MAKSPKRQLGDLGEDIVCLYLERKGFRVLERNYLRKWGEIDIVAKNGSMLSFVEVKSARLDSELAARRVSREPGLGGGLPADRQGSRGTFRPEDNVHPEKLKRLYRAIQTYLLDRRVPQETPWRLDVACVYMDISARKAKVELLENVVL